MANKSDMLNTVRVPKQFEPIFQKAQEYVSTYFSQKKEDASTGTIEVFGQRYILIRAASMSVDFFDTIKGMFKDWGEEKASEMARSLLFDVAHTIGKMDARNFHQRMGLQDPIEKLSAGPIHFSHTGWAFVDISAESKPTADENYYLIYDHPFSFEADAWEKSGKKNISCVCTMNAGYSSGWCEESFGIPLVASEIMCKARGDSACRFIMAHPSRMAQYLQAYLRSHPEISDNAMLYRTGGFFQEFKQAQESLRKSEERFKQVAENAGDRIWEVNAEGLYTYSSPVVEKILGYKPEELVGKKYFYDFFTPDVKEELKKAAFEVFTRKEGFRGLINPNMHKNGSIVILETNGTPIVDDKGNLCGYRGADRDITERKKTEEALRKNEEFTRRVLESSSDCIKVLDLQGHLLSMSGGGQKLLEIDDLTPYLNSSFIDFWKGKEREGCLEAIAKAKKGDTGIFYGYFETAKGTPKWWEVIVTPIKGADGSIDRLLAVSRDITERRRAEKVVENLNKDLKSTVVLLTQSNRQLREFAHLAAHDLKTPLRGIGTLAQWLVDDYKEKFDDEGRRQIDLLVKRVERMNELINAILQYSTITRERDKEYPVDLNTLVGAVLVEIRPPPSIKITINKNLPTVICKEAHLRQVFCHLLTNAIKFMDKPEGHVTIDYTDRDDRWEFSVSDNGPGIEPQHFERIFRIFQTLDDNDQSKGGGIGLTIARKIVELYDGRIWLTSEPGQGSTFFFTLPKALSITNNEKQLLISSSSSSC